MILRFPDFQIWIQMRLLMILGYQCDSKYPKSMEVSFELRKSFSCSLWYLLFRCSAPASVFCNFALFLLLKSLICFLHSDPFLESHSVLCNLPVFLILSISMRIINIYLPLQIDLLLSSQRNSLSDSKVNDSKKIKYTTHAFFWYFLAVFRFSGLLIETKRHP